MVPFCLCEKHACGLSCLISMDDVTDGWQNELLFKWEHAD